MGANKDSYGIQQACKMKVTWIQLGCIWNVGSIKDGRNKDKTNNKEGGTTQKQQGTNIKERLIQD
jgi:hypothetical protein